MKSYISIQFCVAYQTKPWIFPRHTLSRGHRALRVWRRGLRPASPPGLPSRTGTYRYVELLSPMASTPMLPHLKYSDPEKY